MLLSFNYQKKVSLAMNSKLDLLTTMASADPKLHVAVFPWLAFGHMIPYFELAKFIAQKGHKVSFISPPRNIKRLPELPPNLSSLINFVPVTLPQLPELPENAEATMDIPFEKMDYLKKAFDGLEPGVTKFLESSVPDWIIYDFSQYWLPPITKRLGISSVFFNIMSPWFLAFFGPTSVMLETGDPLLKAEEMGSPPEWIKFPTKVALKPHEVRAMMMFTGVAASGIKDWYRYASCVSGCDVYITRHCYEFEPEWLNLLEELSHKPVIPLGLMPPKMKESENSNQTWLSINEWLCKQPSASVVYVALGTEVPLNQDQQTELALGLELSGSPFFWVLRRSHESNDLPEGYLERTKDRGIVCTSWVSQPRILSHCSVGGFLTHCGWGSVIEGLQFGCPLIMLPFVLDQGLNARVLEDNKLGVEVKRDEIDGSFSRNSVAGSICCVMDKNEKGKLFKTNATKMSEIFGDTNLQDGYVDKFVEYLERYRIKAR